ncbi:MAG: TatD family hydrolase [Candidatus Peregrinibacteria bacterium]|nr:TatD family hydrolase [Candidatus Peregrinibacteria bacterium]
MSQDIRLIDTHSHINFDLFDDRREEVIENYKRVGGGKMILVGCAKDSSERAVKFAKEYDNFYATVGVHPTSVNELTDDFLAWCHERVISCEAVAIGETGLDYYHMTFSEEEQIEALRKQARLAKELDIPLIIHSRDKGMVSSKIDMDNKPNPGAVGPCGQMCFDVLQEEGIVKAIFHCFSYNLDFAKKVWEAGYLTSFSGIVTYPKNEYLRAVVLAAPADMFLIETDCPYLSPQSKRGQDNEPAFVFETAKEIAKVRGVSVEEIGELTAQNAERVFF